MNGIDPHSQGFDKEQPTSTPFRFHQAGRKKTVFFKRWGSAVRQSPPLLVVVVIGILVLFGWYFFSSGTEINLNPVLISQVQSPPSGTPSPTQVAAAVASTPTPTATKASTPTPTPVQPTPVATPQPTPQFTPTPVVQRANVTAPAIQETGRFTLQIGAYQDRAEADSHFARIKGLGLPVRMSSVTLPGKGLWHRLQIGRFETRDAATRLGQQLQSQKSITGFMVTAYAPPNS
ncbi:MAG: SPOR domain-containing protein [Acidobacteria bacterium]|nr:SPOR domain-containing protein [Acidobacteriota bacterium]